MKNEWELLRNSLSALSGVKPQLLDYIAVYDILKLCAEGKCNTIISNELNEDIPYIQSVLEEFFQFSGFHKDLDFNSRLWYNRYKYNSYAYLQTARCWDLTSSPEDLRKSFDINKIFEVIERVVEAHYEQS